MKKQARLTKKAKKALRAAAVLAALVPGPLWAQSTQNPAAESYKFGSQIAATSAEVLFLDTFNTGVRPEWNNEFGSWIATNGTYHATTGRTQYVRSTVGGLSLTNFVVNVRLNRLEDGGIWLRYSGSPSSASGVLLVTRRDAIYWHIVHNNSFSPPLKFNDAQGNRGGANLDLLIRVEGNTYTVFLNGSTTPLTTLTTSDFASGTVGVYDNSPIYGVQTFDNFQVSALPTCAGLIATIIGTNGDNVIIGTPGPDVIVGLAGNDVIYGLGSPDVICGGPGDDRISGSIGNDRLFGETGNDILQGDSDNDILVGGASNDIVNGATGNDILIGDAGNDSLDGGLGNDTLNGGVGLDMCDGNIGVDLATTCELVTNLP